MTGDPFKADPGCWLASTDVIGIGEEMSDAGFSIQRLDEVNKIEHRENC